MLNSSGLVLLTEFSEEGYTRVLAGPTVTNSMAAGNSGATFMDNIYLSKCSLSRYTGNPCTLIHIIFISCNQYYLILVPNFLWHQCVMDLLPHAKCTYILYVQPSPSFINTVPKSVDELD